MDMPEFQQHLESSDSTLVELLRGFCPKNGQISRAASQTRREVALTDEFIRSLELPSEGGEDGSVR
jgi:hypothetical protein